MRRRLLVALLAVVLLAVGAAGGYAFGRHRAPRVVSVPIQVSRDGADVDVMIRVMIDGQGPFRFALDTGASSSAVSRRVLRAVDAERTGETADSVDANGDTTTAPLYFIDSWRIGGVRLQRDAVVGDLGIGVEEDGLLGSDQLARLGAVTIDYAHERLVITPR